MHIVTQALQGLLFAGGLAVSPVSQEEAPFVLAAPPAVIAAEASTISAEAPVLASGGSTDETLSFAEMESLAGGTGITTAVVTEQTLTAMNRGNSVNGVNVGSGEINLTSGAFNGFDGVGNFVLNTGHNNNLQSSMNVSIVLAQ